MKHDNITDIPTYLRTFSDELGKRILDSFLPLHGAQEPPSPLLNICLCEYGPRNLPAVDGSKLLVSLAMEGKFSTEGLQAVGEDDDLLMAMARELVTEKGIGESAEVVWKSIQEQNAAIGHAEPSPAELSQKLRLHRTARSSFLRKSLCLLSSISCCSLVRRYLLRQAASVPRAGHGPGCRRWTNNSVSSELGRRSAHGRKGSFHCRLARLRHRSRFWR